MNGTFAVRIMWTMSVCVASDSMNQPDWNKLWCAGAFAPKTYHMSANVAMSKIELIGPTNTMNRPMSSARHCRGTRTYSGSMSSHGIDACEMSYNRLTVSNCTGSIGRSE